MVWEVAIVSVSFLSVFFVFARAQASARKDLLRTNDLLRSAFSDCMRSALSINAEWRDAQRSELEYLAKANPVDGHEPKLSSFPQHPSRANASVGLNDEPVYDEVI